MYSKNRKIRKIKKNNNRKNEKCSCEHFGDVVLNGKSTIIKSANYFIGVFFIRYMYTYAWKLDSMVYLLPKSVDVKRTWWSLSQRRVVHTKQDIDVFYFKYAYICVTLGGLEFIYKCFLFRCSITVAILFWIFKFNKT
jgi:hypothetical protein